MRDFHLKAIDGVGTGDVITLRRGTLALILDPMYDEKAKVTGFAVATITQKERDFRGDAHSDDYIMMPGEIKQATNLSTRHQYPVSLRPEVVKLEDCLHDGMGKDVICHGRIPRWPFVETVLEKIKHNQSRLTVREAKSERKVSLKRNSQKVAVSTPTVSIADACKIKALYPVFNNIVRSPEPGQNVTLEQLYQAALLFQKNSKYDTLRNLIDMQGFPEDFLLEHARERGILTDEKAINELRGQGVHKLPQAFAVAQYLKNDVSDKTLHHLNTQPYAKIAEVIISGKKVFSTWYVEGSINSEIPILRV